MEYTSSQIIHLLPFPYELNTIIHSFCIEDKVIVNTKRLKRIIYYKFEKSIRIHMDNKSLKDITKILKEKDKIVVFKLPFNYDLNEFKKYNYQIYQIKNYLILIIDN